MHRAAQRLGLQFVQSPFAVSKQAENPQLTREINIAVSKSSIDNATGYAQRGDPGLGCGASQPSPAQQRGWKKGLSNAFAADPHLTDQAAAIHAEWVHPSRQDMGRIATLPYAFPGQPQSEIAQGYPEYHLQQVAETVTQASRVPASPFGPPTTQPLLSLYKEFLKERAAVHGETEAQDRCQSFFCSPLGIQHDAEQQQYAVQAGAAAATAQWLLHAAARVDGVAAAAPPPTAAPVAANTQQNEGVTSCVQYTPDPGDVTGWVSPAAEAAAAAAAARSMHTVVPAVATVLPCQQHGLQLQLPTALQRFLQLAEASRTPAAAAASISVPAVSGPAASALPVAVARLQQLSQTQKQWQQRGRVQRGVHGGVEKKKKVHSSTRMRQRLAQATAQHEVSLVFVRVMKLREVGHGQQQRGHLL